MGKGGDASATAGHRSMKLVGDKSEKITWAEVKKHVSFGILEAHALCSLVGIRTPLSIMPLYSNLYHITITTFFNNRLLPRMPGLSTKTKSMTYPTGTNTPVVESSSHMLVMI